MDYEKQGENFLKETNTTFKAEFLKNGLYFEDDTETRDIYLITLKKGEREYKFNFGNSIQNSIKFKIIQGYLSNDILKVFKGKNWNTKGFNRKEELGKTRTCFIGSGKYWEENKDFSEPRAYDVLSCLTSYEPGTFEDFCDNFGYEEDSRKAEKTYKAVLEEWQNLKMLYTDKDLLKLQEIQ